LRCRTSANTGQSRQIFRAATAPDLPRIAEFVAAYEVSSSYGIGAPRNTPADVVDTLNEAVNAGWLADPKLKKQLEDQGGIEMAGTPADFGSDLWNFARASRPWFSVSSAMSDQICRYKAAIGVSANG
jgi:tripartite-type tricarboxylate transporter receptor subunit TctC